MTTTDTAAMKETLDAALADRAAMAERLSQLEEAIGKQAVEHGSFPAQHKGGKSLSDDKEFQRLAENWAFQSRMVYAPESWSAMCSRATAWADARRPAALPSAELDALLTRIDEAFESYERHGGVCEFEGSPMIYAETLTEIAEYRAALKGQENG